MKKQSGFTLVEFSVAMAITLVALLATVMAFRMATYSNQNVTQREDMADNIRAGLNLLEQDVIMTGMGVPIGGITIPTFAPTTACPGGTSNLARPLPTAAGHISYLQHNLAAHRTWQHSRAVHHCSGCHLEREYRRTHHRLRRQHGELHVHDHRHERPADQRDQLPAWHYFGFREYRHI